MPSTENTIKSINQAWLKKFYYKVIAANMVITYKYLNLKSKKNLEFSYHWKYAKEAPDPLYYSSVRN